MYGMIHRGVREMVVELNGVEAWSEIEQSCGIGPVELIRAVVYDDATTLAIVGAAEGLLDRFGETGTVTQCDAKSNGTDFVISLAAA